MNADWAIFLAVEAAALASSMVSWGTAHTPTEGEEAVLAIYVSVLVIPQEEEEMLVSTISMVGGANAKRKASVVVARIPSKLKTGFSFPTCS